MYPTGETALTITVPVAEAVVGRWRERHDSSAVPPYRGVHAEIIPHLTVADGVPPETADAIERELAGLPVGIRASGVTLHVFDGARWRPEAFFPLGELGEAEFAFPGPLRDKLVAAILSGEKTTTTSLHAAYKDEPLPAAGSWDAVVDSAGRRVAIIETVEAAVVPIREIDERFARDEGEGYTSVAEWLAAHTRFWHSPESVAHLGEKPVIDGDTLVVKERFRVLARL